jgi:hypothetical protein
MSFQGQTSRGPGLAPQEQLLALPMVDPYRRRFLISSDGRAGSTLITAILGAAGLDLGLPPVADWNPLGGAYEHPGLDRLNRTLETAEHLTDLSEKFPGLRAVTRLYRSLAKRRVRSMMKRAQCVKCSPLTAAYAFKLGLMPQLIVVYRDFGDLARSKMLLERMQWPMIADRALHTYRNALIGIHTFGGCAISYEEMIDPQQAAWLQALADCTGLDYLALAEARARIARPKPRLSGEKPLFHLDERLDSIERDLRVLRGRYVPPSWQYLRAAAAAKD